ncbi:MAG: hypothetical protein ACXW11_07010 [Methylotenera sp.]
MITGHPTEKIVREVKERDIQHVLDKPFSFKDLLQLVDFCADDAFHLLHGPTSQLGEAERHTCMCGANGRQRLEIPFILFMPCANFLA